MKILQIDKFYYPKYGTGKHVFTLTRELEKQGHTVIPFSMEDEKNEPTPWSTYFVSNVDVSKISFSWKGIKIAFRMIYSFGARRKIRELIEKEKPDIAHIHLIHHHISPSILYELKKQGIPIVQTVHDYKLIHPNYFMWCNNAPCEKVRKHRWNKLIFHRCMKHSLVGSIWLGIETTIHALIGAYKKSIDVWIAPSEFVKRMLVEGGYPEEKIVVLPHALDMHELLTNDYELRTNNTSLRPSSRREPSVPPLREGGGGVSGVDGYLLFFGRLSPERGVDRLLDALKEMPDMPLIIAGDGEMGAQLKDQVKKNGLRNVEFVGYKSGQELKQLIHNARAVVVPTLSHEIFGMSALEAMALGKPIIASHRGALPELVENGKNGWLIDPENKDEFRMALKECMSRDDLIEQFGRASQQKVKELTINKYCAKIVGCYSELITAKYGRESS
ncbi:MAG: hypothetical protein A3H59_02535 [Candidatus Jacksonbacteria bacterium RIFCSPLOWO2_02_FULL_43_9]|nr:MAG: hypothetical protein UV70_C0005G0086 [Parcubacteria group bacterium GW2011_GWA2_43_13]OGY73143.1 MAG: hypothetical protein A3H59_02535 [Candidatus Jacksonbacteria bacterium RIFCSPLOWO2_02_FULL_43_9]